MNTYIWNTEYDVLVGLGKNIDEARLSIEISFIQKEIDNLIDEKDKDSLKNNCIPSYVYNRATIVLRSKIYTLLEIYRSEPIILNESNKGIIYFHGNE